MGSIPDSLCPFFCVTKPWRLVLTTCPSHAPLASAQQTACKQELGCLQCSTFCSVAHDQRNRWRHGRWRRERSKHASQSSRAAGRDTRPSHAVLFCDVQTLRVPVPVIACGLPRVPERSAALCVLRHGYRYRVSTFTVHRPQPHNHSSPPSVEAWNRWALEI